jgi:hypothetical protein
MAYADLEDVTDRWGQPVDDAITKVICRRLGDVERMIARRYKAEGMGTIADQIAAEEVDVEDVKMVEAEAVLRIIRNLEGFYSENDGNYGYQMLQGVATGVLDITDDEWLILGVVDQDGFFIMVPTMAAGS